MNYNARNAMNGLILLARLDDDAAALAFFDPQHRDVLDHLSLGNEGARQQERAKLAAMSPEMISVFMLQLARVVRPTGHVMLWVDKFSLAEGSHLGWLKYAPALRRVGMIAWNKLRFGMGRRERYQSEYLIILQHEPTRAKGIWTDHGISDVWAEAVDKRHAHAKPFELTKRLICAVTKPGDLVVDPAAGGYGVLDACCATGRTFLGCDIKGETDEPKNGGGVRPRADRRVARRDGDVPARADD